MLNPAFEAPSVRTVPFACGLVYGQGDQIFSTVAQDGSQLIWQLLGEGEWDGPALVNSFAAAAGSSGGTATPAIPSHLVRNFVADASTTAWLETLSASMHFHRGSWSTKGATTQATSVGPDQGIDAWFPDLPTFTPPQSLSGLAYAVWRAPVQSGINLKLGYGLLTVSGAAVWRSSRMRMFDAYGDVTGYGFTLNPAWHMIEAMLRFKFKVQQSPLAGLTSAEKALFNWESIAEFAARNDYILPNGNPRFVGNYIFAASTTLAQILETMCRVSRSFIRTQNGQIYLIGNDTRASVFDMGLNFATPGSVKWHKDEQNVSKAPNVFIPQYRDIGIPAVSEIVSITQASSGQPLTFTLGGPDPFLPYGVFTAGGTSVPALDGDYDVGNYIETTSSPSNVTPANWPSGTTFPGPATGGYVGSNDARFSPRAPKTVQHRSAQLVTPKPAPGLTARPVRREVRYDCGNSTYDQTNRVMKFERDSTLGTDIGVGWTAPITGTLTAYLEVVDANGKALIDCGVHDVITLDDWIIPEAPGDFEIMEVPEILGPSGEELGSITLRLRAYNADAATDVSDPPADGYQNVPNDGLALSGYAIPANPACVIQATPLCVVGTDGKMTITVPDLSVQVLGQPSPTLYAGSTWLEVPVGIQVLLYLTDASGIGTGATYTVVVGTGLLPDASGQMLLFAGTFNPASSGSGVVGCVYAPKFPWNSP